MRRAARTVALLIAFSLIACAPGGPAPAPAPNIKPAVPAAPPHVTPAAASKATPLRDAIATPSTWQETALEWRNDLFFCDWNTGSLWRLNLQPPTFDTAGELAVVAQPCRLYVRSGPGGALYFSDHQAIYRLGPSRS